MERNLAEQTDILYSVLDLDKKIIGVRLVRTKEEYDAIDIEEVKNEINYCGMVKAASKGHSFKGRDGKFRCKSGPRVLGIDHVDPLNSKGENWAKLGIYKDSELSEKVRSSLNYNQEDIYGVAVCPLESYETAPDVVIFITSPYNSMRIVQGYSYSYGVSDSISMAGNQAICLEATVRPHLTQEINVSLLCIGTRHRSGWSENDMAVGIPGNKLDGTVEGIFKTLSIMESDQNKKKIESEFEEKNLKSIDMRYGYNYYKDC